VAVGLTLDAGALIALERGDVGVQALLDLAERESSIGIPAGALAQAWRASPRQHGLHLLLGSEVVDVVPLDLVQALKIGALLAHAGTSDVVDASVAVTARERRNFVLTSDPADINRLDPELPVIALPLR
jgi:predicted nucleic acid-binding protein